MTISNHPSRPTYKLKMVISILGIISLSLLLSCANPGNPQSESSDHALADNVKSVSSFIPQNADRYPEINTGNKAVDSAINQKLTALVDLWQCPADGESQFNVERHALSADYLSIEYSAMQMCSGMPSPNSTDAAVTYSLNDGAEVTLASLTQCNSTEQVGVQAGSSDIKARVEGCPAPQFSGAFFMDEDNISLLNFYPSHNDIGCEFEVVKNLSELMCQ